MKTRTFTNGKDAPYALNRKTTKAKSQKEFASLKAFVLDAYKAQQGMFARNYAFAA